MATQGGIARYIDPSNLRNHRGRHFVIRRDSRGARLNASMLLAMTIAVTRFRRTLD